MMDGEALGNELGMLEGNSIGALDGELSALGTCLVVEGAGERRLVRGSSFAHTN